MVLTNIARTLPMLRNIRQANKKWESIRHSIFLNEIHHTTYHDSSGHNHQSTQQPNTGIKGKKQHKGLEQIKALKKLHNILNNTLVTAPTPRENPALEPRQVTFDQAAKPPQESEPNETAPSPRVNNSTERTTTALITTATIDKPITNMPTPRVHKTRSTTTYSMPTSDKNRLARIEMRNRIREHLKAKTMARIPQRNMYLCQNVQWIK
jgi:hypothetical protein